MNPDLRQKQQGFAKVPDSYSFGAPSPPPASAFAPPPAPPKKGGGFGGQIHSAVMAASKPSLASFVPPEHVNPYGSESGPGILESWFNQRANGTDPGYQYAMKRGMDAVDSRMAAGGSYNSGARGQQLSDYAANMGAQREGQLDALAGGASGEHMGRLGMMFQQGLGVAGGQAGQASAYDLGAAGNMSAANNAMNQMSLNKAGVDTQNAQGGFNNLLKLYAAYQTGNSGSGGGSLDYGKV